MRKNFRELLNNRERFLGTFVQLPSPEVVEILGSSGFDFVIIDNEHTETDMANTVGLVRAAEAVDTCVLIRPADATETRIKKALDTGAAGILVPGITGAQMTRDVVYYAKYAPDGMRGACPCVRSNYYGKGGISYYTEANRDTVVTIQVEGANALAEFDEILTVKGLDAVLLGPVDLSMSLGVPGQADHPSVIDAMKSMLERAKKKGVKCAVFSMDRKDAENWFELGMDFIAYRIDSMLFREAAQNAVDELHNMLR